MALRIEVGTEADRWREPQGLGSYEWWYFDGIDEVSWYGFVAIFFRGIPFSGARQSATERAAETGGADRADLFPAVAFTLYGPERTEMYLVNLHDRSALAIDDDRMGISIGESRARYDGGRYIADIREQQLDTRPLVARLELEPIPLGNPGGDLSGDGHLWMLAAPRGRFQLTVSSGDREIRLEGTGYHDHNLGDSSLQAQFRRWDWGRVHLDDRTLVFYRAEGHDDRIASYLVSVAEDGAVTVESVRIETLASTRNLYGVHYPAELLLSTPRESIAVRNERILDNGPFYLRMMGSFRVNGESRDGITEILRPRALDWRWFRTLLNTRVRPADATDRVGRAITAWLVKQGL